MTEEEFDAEFRRAILLRDGGGFEDSVQAFTRLLEAGIHRPAVVSMLGRIIYYEMNDPTRALPILQESVVLSPHSERASLALFHALFSLDRVDEAFDEMRRYLRDHESEAYDELLRDMKEAEQQGGPKERG